MSREERKLRKHLEEHFSREQRKANKQLSKMRANEPKPPRERMDLRAVHEEEFHPPPVKKRTRAEPGVPASAGFVAEIGPGFADIVSSGEVWSGEVSSGEASGGERVRCRSIADIAVGDQVLFWPERKRIEKVLPRRTVLSRTDPHNPRIERVIAANVDVVVNVVSLKTPPLRPGLIDRYLIAIGKSGAQPLLCVNKMDLLAGPEEIEPLRPYQEAGIPVIFCSAAQGIGLDALSAALAGKLCVFAGHSGVGKSSLLNALDPRFHINTRSVSSGNDKGRHTTTSSALYHLPNGGTVIDTPGIREFGLWDVTRADVRGYYQEFEGHRCAFSDCTHTHEPDCAVKAVIESGEISEARYQGYLRILSSLETGS